MNIEQKKNIFKFNRFETWAMCEPPPTVPSPQPTNAAIRASLPSGAAAVALSGRFWSSPGFQAATEGTDMAPKDKVSDWPEAAQANARRSVLAGDLVVDGDVTSEGPVEVHGKIVGSARAPGIVIAAAGRIEGVVSAHDLTVEGAVSGSIVAREVRLATSAIVHADVLHERIAIESGAELEGRLKRKV